MAPPRLTVGRYNPRAYVPGGAPRNVAQAIQRQGIRPPARVPTPKGYNPSFFSGGYLQDPGVAGQTTGDYTAPPTTYTQGGQTISLAPRVANPFGANRPDINSLISGDWEVQSAIDAMGSRMAGLRSAFGENVKQGAIDLGFGDTAKLGKFGSYIDQDTIAKAIANKYSANAQIQQGQDISNAKSQAALAARGALSSGQATKEAGDIGASAEKSRYDALQSFLSSGEQGLTGLANEESSLAGQVAQARANAAQRASQYDLGWLDYEANANQAGQPYDFTDPNMAINYQGSAPITNPASVAKPKAVPKPKPVAVPFHTSTFPNQAGKITVKPAAKKKK